MPTVPEPEEIEDTVTKTAVVSSVTAATAGTSTIAASSSTSGHVANIGHVSNQLKMVGHIAHHLMMVLQVLGALSLWRPISTLPRFQFKILKFCENFTMRTLEVDLSGTPHTEHILSFFIILLSTCLLTVIVGFYFKKLRTKHNFYRIFNLFYFPACCILFDLLWSTPHMFDIASILFITLACFLLFTFPMIDAKVKWSGIIPFYEKSYFNIEALYAKSYVLCLWLFKAMRALLITAVGPNITIFALLACLDGLCCIWTVIMKPYVTQNLQMYYLVVSVLLFQSIIYILYIFDTSGWIITVFQHLFVWGLLIKMTLQITKWLRKAKGWCGGSRDRNPLKLLQESSENQVNPPITSHSKPPPPPPRILKARKPPPPPIIDHSNQESKFEF